MRRLTLPDSGGPIEGAKRHAPSAARNMEPIAAVLAQHLPATGRALELASGTGQHIGFFAARFTGLIWQPSDINPDNLASIRAWASDAPRENLCDPVLLDACTAGWAADHGGNAAICLTNLLHLISQPEAEILLTETARALAPDGVFCLYGPFKRTETLISEGDRAFDESLRAQDPAIGYKNIEWVETVLTGHGLAARALHEMPASNLMLVMQLPAHT
ncbi:MAG: DUF938 domain-containing protein [Pararhodobacter sp.]|nr:DUF938 domain-containing protein [Pararhodobacter sp.]